MRRVQIVKKTTTKILLTEKQQIEFALRRCDEESRSIIECGHVPVLREKGKALYKYNVKSPDRIMLKDIDTSLLYLRSRDKDLPFKMTEKEGFVWFDNKKE